MAKTMPSIAALSQMEVRKLKRTAEEQLQLNKICELEDKFVKGFSKEKWKEYFDLDIEKGQLHNLEIDRVIKIAYKVCKKLFK